MGSKCKSSLIQVHIWDLRVGEATQTLVGPRITGDAIDFREDLILTGSSRVVDQLQLWDYRTKEVLHTYTWD
jgi:COMPASS component SWD3